MDKPFRKIGQKNIKLPSKLDSNQAQVWTKHWIVYFYKDCGLFRNVHLQGRFIAKQGSISGN